MHRRHAGMWWLAVVTAVFLVVGCGTGGRDAHDISADFEGVVSAATVDRLVRNVDLQRSALTVQVGQDEPTVYANEDQPTLEAYLREAAVGLAGDHVRVTQQVVDDTGAGTQRLTVTLEVDHAGTVRYVPVVLTLARDGRRMFVTRARVL